MFDQDDFISYVGDKSGSNYAWGLKKIEHLYDVDITTELKKDACTSLLERIEADKKIQILLT